MCLFFSQITLVIQPSHWVCKLAYLMLVPERVAAGRAYGVKMGMMEEGH